MNSFRTLPHVLAKPRIGPAYPTERTSASRAGLRNPGPEVRGCIKFPIGPAYWERAAGPWRGPGSTHLPPGRGRADPSAVVAIAMMLAIACVVMALVGVPR